MRPFDDITRLERAQSLDRPAAVIRTIVQKVLGDQRVKDVLHGVWLGHPLHPALAAVTAGSFISATMLDAVGKPVGGGRAPSSFLIASGLALTPPTVAAGWADWSVGHEDQQRVGLVHASANVLSVALYAAALAQRVRGTGSGRLLSIAAGTASGLGAMLGGHMGYRQALGANHAEEVPHIGPAEWQSLGAVAEVPVGKPVRRIAGDVAVMVVRRSDATDAGSADGAAGLSVLADRCPHLAAPLHEGDLVEVDGDGHIICPWHGSEFRVSDGCLVHGPATAPVPRFEARVVDGELQARVVPIPGVLPS
jgi:nitrite reductase/ring-hydroxylating ferredoxin subunit